MSTASLPFPEPSPPASTAPLVEARAKENQRGGQGGVLLPQNSAKAKIDTREEIAKVAGSTAPAAAQVATVVTRWCIVAIRSDGRVDVVGQLFHSRLEADRQAAFYQKEWRLVTVQTAKVLVEVQHE